MGPTGFLSVRCFGVFLPMFSSPLLDRLAVYDGPDAHGVPRLALLALDAAPVQLRADCPEGHTCGSQALGRRNGFLFGHVIDSPHDLLAVLVSFASSAEVETERAETNHTIPVAALHGQCVLSPL